MQRLTKRIRHTETVAYVGEHKRYDTGDIPPEMNTAGVRDVLQLLAAYEDIGLTPEHVQEKLKNTYTAQEIEDLKNEGYDLGVESVLHERFGLTWKDAEELREEIEKVKAVTKWIPADVALPAQEEVEKCYEQYREHPQYIVMIANAVEPTVLAFDGESFYDPYADEPYNVTHWMKLPPAPEVQHE